MGNMNGNMAVLVPRAIAEGVSLREIMVSLNAQVWEYGEEGSIRITSKQKPDITILVAYCDVTADMVSFLGNHPAYSQVPKKDIVFEAGVFDFVVVAVKPTEGGGFEVTTVALLELLAMQGAVDTEGENARQDWLLDRPEWDVVELVDPTKSAEPEGYGTPTDMNVIG